MRRTFSFYIPTLLLCLSTQIQSVGSFLLWLSNLAPGSIAYAAGPPTTISGTPAGVGGLNTLVNSSPATVCTANCVITGGTRPGGGSNLFHSLGQFNIGAGDIATFQNGISFNTNGTALPAGLLTSNILARITGTNGNNPTLSSIYGTLQTSGFGNANLFLINPAGFLFGPNATVNVGGMVAFTSADYLRLQGVGGDGIFYAHSTANSVLTTSPVAAYGFLGSNPGAITVQGSQLTVTPGQNLSLVGGNITVQSGTLDNGTVQSAKLSAPGGQINLASVASPGELLTGTLAQAPNVNGQSFGNLGAIQITDKSVIDASGNGGGSVLIRGGNFVLDNSTISANITGPGPFINGVESIAGGIDVQASQNAVIQNGALIDASVVQNATPGVQYGGIHVKADHIEVRGIADFNTGNFVFTNIQTTVAPETVGNSGNILLEGNSILLKDAGQVQTLTNGIGNAGNITLKANQDIDIVTSVVQSAAQPTFDQTGNLASHPTGDAGNIELSSAHGNISITNLSGVTSQVVDSPGRAGNITMNALEGTILISDSAFFTYIQPPPNADGVRVGRTEGSGEVRVNANNMQMNGGQIDIVNLSNKPGGDVTVTVTGTLSLGAGSFIPLSHIQAASVDLLDGTTGGAPSAGLNVKAHDIIITDGSSISTDTVGSGAAGPLNISVVNLQLATGGKISSSSRQGVGFDGLPLGPPPSGPAGNITIQGLAGTPNSVLIDGAGSGIFTTTVGTGAGGNINLLANNLTVQNGGTLSAATSGTSPSATGGAITINANQLQVDSGGLITAATTGAGAAGHISVQGLASPAKSVLIDGAGSGIFSDTHATGAGGNLLISANSVTLQNGGSLSAVTSGTSPSATGGTITLDANQVQVNSGGLITAATTGAGAGGSVNINAADTFSSNAGTVSSTASQATGGNINIAAGNSVTLTNGASLSASSTGPGNAGNISINSGTQLLMQDSSIRTEAAQAGGGNIEIQAVNLVQLGNSTVSTSVLGGGGSGGNITIDPNAVVLQNSQILAQAVQGSGGNINIITNLLLPDTASIISASSQFGQQGNIVIQSPISPASGKIIPLSQKPLVPTTLLNQRCAALAAGNVSSFTVAGRDSLPAEPGGWVSSPLALAAPAANAALQASVESGPEDRNEVEVISVRKIAPAGFLTQTFAGSTDCAS